MTKIIRKTPEQEIEVGQDCPSVYLRGSLSIGSHYLFQDLDFHVPAGLWTCLLGSSGIGKTTLLRLFANLPVHGDFDGQCDAGEAGVAYMAQDDLLLPWLDVFRNVTLGSRLRNEREDEPRAHQLIEKVGLTEHANKKPGQLSGGMRQRAALARTLMEDKPVVLLDEPFSALDSRTRAEMQELAFEIFQGKTVLLVTHDPGEAARLGDHIWIMHQSGIEPYLFEASKPLRSYDDSKKMAMEAELLLLLTKGFVQTLGERH